MCGNGATPNQQFAIRILQWLLVAQRPLRKSELECGIVLHEHVPRVTSRLRARGNVLSLCNPIVDVDDDPAGSVSFTHFTVQELVSWWVTLKDLALLNVTITDIFKPRICLHSPR